MPEPKKVPFEKIPEELPGAEGVAPTPHPLYEMMREIIRRHHLPSLADCKIVLMWRKEWKPNRDGIIILGQAVKIGDRERQLSEYDAEILINYEWWNDPRTTEDQKKALLDHELCHIRPVPEDADDPNSLSQVDENERVVYYMRKHSVEEFHEIIQRHGCYKDDLQRAYTLMRIAEGQQAEENEPGENPAA